MKCTIPEIFWHNREPVLSVDIQPKPLENDKNVIRLASGGSDSHVLIWYISYNEMGSAQLTIASDLTRHQKAVNVVRWSPSGELLASGDDESVIFVWKLKNENEPVNIMDDSSEQDKEVWLIYKTLRCHLEDVYDLSWSMDSLSLISGSVDNTAVIWDVNKGKSKTILNDHKGFVQGVAWDPLNKMVATLSTDRYFRTFDINTNKVLRRLHKSTYPVPESSPFYNKMIRLFHDDTLATFYRRFCFSPDGLLIIVPSGCSDILQSGPSNIGATENNENAEKPEVEEPIKPINTTYIFSRYSTKRPLVVLPSPDHFTVAVRCCPRIFELRPHDESNPPVIDLPYRMVFAVLSKSAVYLYDTQQKMPFGCVSNIHYARLTDVTWSADGCILIVSSVDGFCTLITFEENELGTVYDKPIIYKDEPKEKGKRTSGEHKTNSSATSTATTSEEKGTKTDPTPSEKTDAAKPDDLQKLSKKLSSDKIIVKIPETIIATTESFESPEYKEKIATPIATRREPRKSVDTPTNKTPKSISKSSSAQKPKPIAVRRQPRNILASPVVVDKSAADQDEALDAWPIPISDTPSVEKVGKAVNVEKMCVDETEDMRLVYEGDSESIVLKSADESSTATKTKPDEQNGNQAATPDSKNVKTPRRVTLRTISTPKSKKKLLN